MAKAKALYDVLPETEKGESVKKKWTWSPQSNITKNLLATSYGTIEKAFEIGWRWRPEPAPKSNSHSHWCVFDAPLPLSSDFSPSVCSLIHLRVLRARWYPPVALTEPVTTWCTQANKKKRVKNKGAFASEAVFLSSPETSAFLNPS
jgi:hypothetical protein